MISVRKDVFTICILWLLFCQCLWASALTNTTMAANDTSVIIEDNNNDNETNVHDTNVFHSPYILRTCCALDLENLEPNRTTNCGDDEHGRAAVNIYPKASVKDKMGRWTFPQSLMLNNESTSFRLTADPLDCTSGSTLKSFNISLNTTMFMVMPDGYLVILPEDAESSQNRDYYNTNQYCINGFAHDSIEFQICNSTCSMDEPCINKCCQLDSVVSRRENGQWACIPGLSQLSPIYHQLTHDNDTFQNLSNWDYGSSRMKRMADNAFYFTRDPTSWKHKCAHNVDNMFDKYPIGQEASPLGINHDRMYLVMEKGEIMYRQYHEYEKTWVVANFSCVDGFKEYKLSNNSKIPATKMVIFDCEGLPPNKVEDGSSKQIHTAYGIICIVCSIFALATVLIYAFLWDRNNHAHGWTFMTLAFSMFCLYLSMGIGHLISNDIYNIKSQLNSDMESKPLNFAKCRITARACHFFGVAMSSWLAMMSLDLWLTFRSITETGDSRIRDNVKYCLYSVFSWGIPTLLLVLSLIYEKSQAGDSSKDFETLAEHCLSSTSSIWEYLYGPMLATFGLTILIFILTTAKLLEYKRCTEFSINAIPNGKTYALFTKLLGVILAVWIIKMIIWNSGDPNESSATGLIFYTITCLQPFAIFSIFVLKWDVLNALAEKSSILNCILSPVLVLLGDYRYKGRLFQSTTFADDEDLRETAPLSSTTPLNYSTRRETDYFDDLEDTQNA